MLVNGVIATVLYLKYAHVLIVLLPRVCTIYYIIRICEKRQNASPDMATTF